MGADKSGWTLVDYASEACAAAATAAENPTHVNQLAAAVAQSEYKIARDGDEDLGEGWTRLDYRTFVHESGAEVAQGGGARRWAARKAYDALRGPHGAVKYFATAARAAEAVA